MIAAVPEAIILTELEPRRCDLAAQNCTFTCETSWCTYPKPLFKWLFGDVSKVIM